MADRIVYLVDKLPRNAADATVELVDDAGLSQLVASGFEVGTTLAGRKVTVGGKSLKATMMVLKPAAENRGVARSRSDDRDDDDHQRPSRREMVQVTDEFGIHKSLTPAAATLHELTRALANVGAPGHLGGSRNHSMPGMSIVSGEMVGKAYDLGSLAAARSEGPEVNPFGDTMAGQKWLEGYRNAAKQLGRQVLSQEALDEAYRMGNGTATSLGPDDVAHCPFSDQRKAAWLKGFRDGGGRVEG